jgi:hypothetical protein
MAAFAARRINTAVRRLTCALVLAASFWIGGSAVHADDCPPVSPDSDAVDADCLNAEVPTVDAGGEPIPYVEEITAPPLDTALVPDSP